MNTFTMQRVSWPDNAPCRPEFMVIGAPKCGTTSLYDYLATHQQVQPPARKELCFFSKFKRHLQRYKPLPSSSWLQYVAAFAGHEAWQAAVIREANSGGEVARHPRGRSGRGRNGRNGRHGGRGWRNGQQMDIARGMPFSRSQDSIAAGRLLARSMPSDQCVASGRRAFEACPFYLGEVHAPMALRTVFPHLRAIAVLRNPRERTTSAFNDYVRVGRIRRANATASGMESLIYEKLRLLATKQRTLESFDMRMLTSGVYIHGLRKWGDPGAWPQRQLLVLRSEDLFGSTVATMGRVQQFLGLSAAFQASALQRVHNKNPIRKARPSRKLNETLDAFFAPYNEELYAWAAARNVPFARWENASN